jgi:menaquinone-dependent protoporphyrinogen oxidase
MRVLVAYGSKRGGTAGLAGMLGDELRAAGADVVVADARRVQGVSGYDAVIVGGALYANRWHRSARRFIRRFASVLGSLPVWLFSSGPLDGSAPESDIPPVRHVLAAMERVGGRGHMTFGGRLEPDVRGFPASAMAKKTAGDWRDPQHVARWARAIMSELTAVAG